MSRPAILTPAARREVTEAVRGIARERPLVARRLRAAIVDAAHLLGRHPLAGRLAPDLVGERYRVWSLPAFSYILVYDPAMTPPEILRLAHTARDLGPLLADLAAASDEAASTI